MIRLRHCRIRDEIETLGGDLTDLSRMVVVRLWFYCRGVIMSGRVPFL